MYVRACEREMTYCLMKLSIQAELAAGIFLHAKDAALMTKSFTESLTPSPAKVSFNSDRSLQAKYHEKNYNNHSNYVELKIQHNILKYYWSVILYCWLGILHDVIHVYVDS